MNGTGSSIELSTMTSHDEEVAPLVLNHSHEDSNGGGGDNLIHRGGAAGQHGGSIENNDSDVESESESSSYHGYARAFSQRISEHIGKIGFLGSMSIAVNSITGPAMLNIPDTYQRCGVIPTTVTVILVCILSALCCLHMANTISKVPGNSNFKKEIEYSETFEKFWGHRYFVLTQVLFYCCITCLNVSSIVDTAQVVDTIVGHWFPGGTGAITFTKGGNNNNNKSYYDDNNEEEGEGGTATARMLFPTIHLTRWDYTECSEEMLADGDCVPFGEEDGIVFSLGYAVTLIIFVPMALMDLKENAFMQVIGFLVLVATSIQFIFLFAREGLHPENLSLWGENWDTLFGVVLFNFALVIAVPAWLYEKEPHVDVPTVIHSSSIMSAVLYIVIGILGAMTMPNVSQNMLESMMSGALGLNMEISASIFAFFIIGLGCPLFSVLARMNLTGSGLVSHNVGNILAVFFPFSLSWLFYQGDSITQLLSWGGIMFTSLVAFILPILISIHALDTSQSQGVIAVYGEKWKHLDKWTHKILLNILLVTTILAILAAIIGNIF